MLHRYALLPLACASLLAACTEQQSNTADTQQPLAQQPPTSSGAVLPLTNDAAAQANAAASENAAEAAAEPAIPAALHGRWGLKPADCRARAGTTMGLVEITADEVRFHESTARPSHVIERTDSRIRGEFDFKGEGGTWTNHMIWSAEGDKLTRVDSEEDSRQVYTRC